MYGKADAVTPNADATRKKLRRLVRDGLLMVW